MSAIKAVAFALVLVGALNWGLWGIAQFDLVATIFGGNTAPLARLVYALVGVSAVVLAGLQLAGSKEPRGSLAAS